MLFEKLAMQSMTTYCPPPPTPLRLVPRPLSVCLLVGLHFLAKTIWLRAWLLSFIIPRLTCLGWVTKNGLKTWTIHMDYSS